MKKLIFTVILLACSPTSPWAASLTTVTNKHETSDLTEQVKYPQGFAEKNIDEAIKTFIVAAQKDAESALAKNSAPKGAGKNTLYIDYSTKFANKNVLSLLFKISVYPRGAAHPDNRIQVLNFIHGQSVTLADLFKKDSDYLNQLAPLSYNSLAAKKNLGDNQLLLSGTKAIPENYRNWYFTPGGLAIVFDTYQVAPYIYGPQTVMIPKEKLANYLRPEIAALVWGKNE